MKNWHKLSALIFLLVILFVYIGCSDRKNPTDVVYPSGTVWVSSYVSNSFLAGNLIGNPQSRNIFVYVPPGYNDTTRYPVLYFLHGFMDTTLGSRGPGLPYPYGLAETADRLIAAGQIQPMIIAMADCNSKLGGSINAGSFYVNSPSPTSDTSKSLNGKFESFYVREFIPYVENAYNVRRDKACRAIAGHSMGGYGAFRIAMDYPDTFSIVGSMSGPLSFGDWDLTSATGAINHIFTVNGVIDPTVYRDSLNKAYEGPDELTRMFFAMAAAFSPHRPTDPMSSYFKVTSPQSATVYGVDLPFDSAQNIRPSVWNNRWIDSNDVYTIYNRRRTADPNFWDGMAVYIDCGDADEFGFNDQSSAFLIFAPDYGVGKWFFEEYSGGGYLPADNSTYLYYRMEDLLKFVSKNFPTAGYEGMLLSSSAFSNGGAIPNLYCYNVSQGDGVPPGAQNKSIPLSWSNIPSETQSFAISMIDPNGGDSVHWLVLNIPSTTTSLNAGVSLIPGATEYTNRFHVKGYGGPLPPKDDDFPHHYVITVYALSASSLSFTDNTGTPHNNLASFNNTISGKILDKVSIVGTYDW